MKIISSNKTNTELPFDLHICFEGIYKHIVKQANDSNSPIQKSAIELKKKYENQTILREGFSDFSKIEEHQEEISYLLDYIFPEALQENEIKAVSIPFNFTTFKFSKRFEKILENAGDDYNLEIRNIDESSFYVMACTFILAFYYNIKIDFKRPFFFDIPNQKTGEMHHYRVMFNSDFSEIIKTDQAPDISEEDIKILIDNFDQPDKLALWKEKFPPNSYIFKGFGILNLFDVTSDEILSSIKEDLLSIGGDAQLKLEKNLIKLFGLPNLKLGFSKFNLNEKKFEIPKYKVGTSFILSCDEYLDCNNMVCEGINQKVINQHNFLAVSDIERYGEHTGFNNLYRSLKSNKIESFILVPIPINDDFIGILELVSTNKFDLNSLNANKLKDVIPVFTVSIQRVFKEYAMNMESIIQENYTAIHPSVKWRFYDAVERYSSQLMEKGKISQLEDIVFKKVYPLYGQCDIKGSSTARNNSIQSDLSYQLSEAKIVMSKALKFDNLPIYSELNFRIEQYYQTIKKGLKTVPVYGVFPNGSQVKDYYSNQLITVDNNEINFSSPFNIVLLAPVSN